ncbi:hypothetical protein PRUPE_4G171200 [Prunus persica]|uniref:Uncharacterized protein n=1 Tax=Prunus persica TaxID=3760 RepID=M5WHS4_PRUPE|nr:uncharacterized protein LOC18778623 [Prunus persica]ONI12553.1 hypothetical protein PRUPE_4G171200 [Prunus persica]
MAQEDQTQKCSNTSSGASLGFASITRSSSKKTKQKKVPQRGLGVAQLEKIRLEDQQKKAAAAVILSTPSSLSSPTKSTSSSCPSVPIRHFYHSNHNQPPSSIPFPSLPSLDLPSPNSIFRPPLIPTQNIDVIRKPISTVPLGNNNNNNGGHGFEIQGHGNNNVPNLWNPCDFNLDQKESSNSGIDPGLAFRSTLNLPFESNNPIWPLTNVPQRTQPYHQQPPPPPPSMVNVSSATSSSSVLNFQIEPPSNQSYYSNYTPMWPDEEKMVGMKRPYPFSLDNPPGPSINFKFPTFVAPMRADEASSCGNRYTFNLEPSGNPIFREAPSCSTSISESNSRNSIKENGSVNGDFLTLAPPTTSSRTCPSPKLNLPSTYLAFHNREVPEFESFSYQGNAEDTNFQPGPSFSHPQQAFYSFFPPAKAQIGRAATTINNNCNGELGESVDLNLKL